LKKERDHNREKILKGRELWERNFLRKKMVYIQPDMWINWAQEDINGFKKLQECRKWIADFYLYK